MGSFTFRWPYNGNEVFVTGTFDDWGKTVHLDRNGDVFEKTISLPDTDEKIQYKFVVDGNWTTDSSAPQESIGGNINNVLYLDQIKDSSIITDIPQLSGAAVMSGVTPDSSTAALAANVPKESEKKASTLSSAAPESTTANLAKQIPFENNNNEGVPGSFPDTPATEAETFSVNPIPASSGASNPIKLKPGEKVPDPSTTHSSTVQSTARTDLAGYEQDPSGSLAGLPTATNPAASHPNPSGGRRQSKIVPESGLPVDGESVGLTDTGITIETTTPSATTVGLASAVPLESQKQHSSSGAGGPVSEVPSRVRNSISEAHQDPEAAASKGAVEEKKEFEDELKQKVKPTEAGGTPGPTTTAATTETAPVTTGGAFQSGQVSPRSPSPSEPTVTTGVASSKAPGVSNAAGVSSPSSEGPTVTTGPAESKAPEVSSPKDTSAPEGAGAAAGTEDKDIGKAISEGTHTDARGHSSLTGPPRTSGSTSGPATGAGQTGTKSSEPKQDGFKPGYSKQTGAGDTSATNGNGNGNGTVRKDYADQAQGKANDVAKEQKKKHRGSGLFQKLKEKFK
ncbi:carbohydrate-binding module family 48 protein [Aspergillus ruber CBS 135680]|uniref:AMP-activated protein kinase glycogen-binding domain-containing protein n=1 Tax=Aspergillus ruber (strain CBS 135680) TaxID=1388766 RepID=A0A017SN57_ASPRC|nr:uncharacterized protein EURHEDRAFT_409574 [Aspergillus ruber CBS 135680]EYE98236.1 hypothetical protein EURHEDRAFT_409574 [Aspergillus ruber CBS 135680]